jgi:hypothetical protein
MQTIKVASQLELGDPVRLRFPLAFTNVSIMRKSVTTQKIE